MSVHAPDPQTGVAEEEEGVGPVTGGGYPVAEPPTDPGPTRERWLWTALVVGVGLLIFGLMVFGGAGGLRPELKQVSVADVLAPGQLPAERYGAGEIRVVGWYAAAITGCRGTTVAPVASAAPGDAAWLEAECPVRVLLPAAPSGQLTQDQLLREGLRLAAPNGLPFPPPTPTGSGTAGLEQLVFVGHFDDPAAGSCTPSLTVVCRNTFVVSEYSGQIK